jgi:glycine cleavage system H protein
MGIISHQTFLSIFVGINCLAPVTGTLPKNSQQRKASFALLQKFTEEQAMSTDLKYAKSDEWIRPATGEVGLTNYAQGRLSDIVYVELPEVGASVTQGAPFGSIESVKATSELKAPASGTIAAVNENLSNSPDLVNRSPDNLGWIIKIDVSDAGELASLMDAAAYNAYCAERG